MLAMAVADEGLGDGFAEALDVERLAGGEVRDAGDGLGGALEIGAAPGDEAFFLRDRAAAGRALAADVIEEEKRFRAAATGWMTLTMAGMISPAFSTSTVSPMRMSLRSISSSLWRVARETVEPEMRTGSSSATGVSTPVRPTWMVMSLSVVSCLLGEELVGGGPARGAGGEAELFAFGAVEDLDDGAVGAVVEVVAVRG